MTATSGEGLEVNEMESQRPATLQKVSQVLSKMYVVDSMKWVMNVRFSINYLK